MIICVETSSYPERRHWDTDKANWHVYVCYKSKCEYVQCDRSTWRQFCNMSTAPEPGLDYMLDLNEIVLKVFGES